MEQGLGSIDSLHECYQGWYSGRRSPCCPAEDKKLSGQFRRKQDDEAFTLRLKGGTLADSESTSLIKADGFMKALECT